MAIPGALLFFASRRRDVPFHRVFLMFGLFIVSCGLTHLVGIWTFFDPVYRLDGLLKAVTAVASVATVAVMVPMIPKALGLPGMAVMNETLRAEVAERTAAEQAACDREQRLRAVVETAVDAIIVIDAEGIIESFNPAAERMFGYSSGEVAGRNVSLLMPPPYRGEHDGYIGRYLRTGDRRVIGIGREVSGLRRDGTTFPAELAVSEMRISGRTMFTGVIRDITERKMFERQSSAHAAALEQKNRELQDARASMERSVAALKASNAELDDFAYVASHDLKEPLRGIHNYASFVVEDYNEKLDDQGRKWLDGIARLAKRMEELIESLLYFSRVGRVDLAVVPTDLNKTVDEVENSLHAYLEEAGAAIVRSAPLPTLRCDRVRVAEVFRNLIVNGVKYNDRPDKVIAVGVRAAAAADPVAAGATVFSVRDNGIGIPERHRAQVFTIFKRLHARDKYGGGTGAGLTIVRKIIERHGGRIWIESTEGEGSTFCFTVGEGAVHEREADIVEPAHSVG